MVSLASLVVVSRGTLVPLDDDFPAKLVVEQLSIFLRQSTAPLDNQEMSSLHEACEGFSFQGACFAVDIIEKLLEEQERDHDASWLSWVITVVSTAEQKQLFATRLFRLITSSRCDEIYEYNLLTLMRHTGLLQHIDGAVLYAFVHAKGMPSRDCWASLALKASLVDLVLFEANLVLEWIDQIQLSCPRQACAITDNISENAWKLNPLQDVLSILKALPEALWSDSLAAVLCDSHRHVLTEFKHWFVSAKVLQLGREAPYRYLIAGLDLSEEVFPKGSVLDDDTEFARLVLWRLKKSWKHEWHLQMLLWCQNTAELLLCLRMYLPRVLICVIIELVTAVCEEENLEFAKFGNGVKAMHQLLRAKRSLKKLKSA